MPLLIIVGLVFIFSVTTYIITKKTEKIIKNFNDDFSKLLSNYIAHSDIVKFKKLYNAQYIRLNVYPFKSKTIRTFLELYSSLEERAEYYNNLFVEKEIKDKSELFTNLENKSLDYQQQVACVVNEDANLVVAGAGSGKTLTILGKVRYLLNKGYSPDDILCISFTNKVCDELKERLNKLTGSNIDVFTFHKLSLNILGNLGIKYKIADENKIREILELSLKGIRTKDFMSSMLNLMVYCNNYVKLQTNDDAFDKLLTIKDVCKYAQEMSEVRSYQRGKTDLITLCEEKVKSEHELNIANFLFTNGIKYEYESFYKVEEDFNYKPDFYLPDYDIYIEHFGIDESGVASWIKNEEERAEYTNIMEDKIELHKRHNTKLICTYSYERDNLIPLLVEKLNEHNVELKPCAVEMIDLLNKLYNFDDSLLETVSSFIKLFKNRCMTLQDFKSMRSKAKVKESLALSLIEKIYIEYQNALKSENLIDFEDMINLANEKLQKGKLKLPYKYIIVDEYQDVSINKVNLLKHIMKLNKAKLMAVGDDWQSIYRFAGSEVSLISNFDKEFKHSKIMKIEKTYRNSKQLISVAGEFIKQNPNQINKELKSDKDCYKPIIVKSFAEDILLIPSNIDSIEMKKHYISESNEDKRIILLKEIVEEIYEQGKNDALLLVRNNNDLGIIRLWVQNPESKVKVIKNDNSQFIFKLKDVVIRCMTIHRSKGLESDNVILFDIREGFRALPDTMGDDLLLKFVIASKEEIEFAEDRRLFYVALTRTKNKVYIISRAINESRFISEISSLQNVDSTANYFKCPKCNGEILKIPEHNFYGCSNYSLTNCNFTLNVKNDEELVDTMKIIHNLKENSEVGQYVKCKILDMIWVKNPIKDSAIRVKYGLMVGSSVVKEFGIYLDKSDNPRHQFKVSRFISTTSNDFSIEPFEQFEMFKKKHIGLTHYVHICLNDKGDIELKHNSGTYFESSKEF